MPFKDATRVGAQRKIRISHSAIVIPFLTLFFFAGLLVMHFSDSFIHAAPASEVLVPFSGTISPLLGRSHLRGQADPNQHISLSIGLRPRNEVGLANYVRDISRPSSVNYHRFLNPAQVADVFGPRKQAYSSVIQFLQSSGFTISHTYNHRLLVSFGGTIGLAEQIFHIVINNYSAPDGHVFYANATDPYLPQSQVVAIQSISGLNNAVRLHHPPLTVRNVKTQAPHPSAGISCPAHGNGYLLPDQTASAYDLNRLYNAHYQGEGQTIALFELSTFQMSDLTNYVSCFGHGHTAIETALAGQGPVATNDGLIEVELDAELVLSAAPQLGVLRIYEAANDPADINAEWARIVQEAPPIVSTSWGLCEQDTNQQEAALENTFFTEAAAQGESIFAASGDSGTSGCAFDGASNPPPYTGPNAGDPASQPFVTGVGGTTLTLNGTAYGGETTWNNPPTSNYSGGASGGGISQFWPAPSWQNAPGVNNSYSTNTTCPAPSGTICRETPDVSLNADPLTGYLFYCSSTVARCDANGGWYVIAGTSAAAPMWAAMLALTNEMSVKMGYFNIGFVNPLLYQVANNPTSYTSSFHDITSGNNDFNNYNNGKYPATSGYDMATGLGSYDAFNLATALVTLSQTATGPRSSPANTNWYFAEGSVGGSFQEFLTLQNPSAAQDALVDITYLFESQGARVISHSVPMSSRVTINVNQDLGIKPTDPQQAISAIVQVTSGPGIVAERPMYFNFKGIQSGTDTIGATSPGKAYYFSEADTRQSGRNYYTYITMLNPSSTQPANVVVTFYNGSCGQTGQPVCAAQAIQVAPLHRGTVIPPWNMQMAISVTSDQPVVVERPMYFRDTIPTAGGLTTGAASQVGATAPGTDWLFAEGYTASNFQEYFVLSNFGSTDSTATIKLEYSNGSTQTVPVVVPALNQIRFDVNKAYTNPTGTCQPTPCALTTTVSAEITATAPIVADRLMYFHYGSSRFSGGTDVVGEPGPASHNVYAFAEGYTANTFQEYLTLQNPTNNDETVAVTLFADTYVIQQQVIVKAHSRQTLGINGMLVPIAQAYTNMGANSFAVSMSVQALGNGSVIVAERPMYFNFYGDPGGTDTIGYTGG